MVEQEKSYYERQQELKRETERALLTAIKESAERFDQPSALRELAEAYAAVMQNKAASEKGAGGRGGRVTAL